MYIEARDEANADVFDHIERFDNPKKTTMLEAQLS